MIFEKTRHCPRSMVKHTSFSGDLTVVTWTKDHMRKHNISGQCYVVEEEWFRALPKTVEADDWRHLASKLPLPEFAVRSFYRPTERGQPSATQKARGI